MISEIQTKQRPTNRWTKTHTFNKDSADLLVAYQDDNFNEF